LTSGSNNIGIGVQTLLDAMGSSDNIAIGNFALHSVVSANGENLAIGSSALTATTGGANVAVGYDALTSNITGAQLIGIGANVNVSSTNFTNSVGIGSYGSSTNLITASNGIFFSAAYTSLHLAGVSSLVLNGVTYSSLPSSNSAGVLTNNGSGALTWASAGSGTDSLFRKQISLDSTQLQTANSVPIQLIAAPAANYVIQLVSVIDSFTYNGDAYTPTTSTIIYTVSGQGLTISDNTISGITSGIFCIPLTSIIAGTGTAQPLMLISDADAIQGNGSIRFTILYRLLKVN